jgi:hypothetical protein
MGSCISSPVPQAEVSEDEKARNREIERQLKEVRRSVFPGLTSD